MAQDDPDDEPPLSSDAEVEELAWRIKRRVNCKKLRFSPCLKAAQAVVDGEISRHSIEELLENLDALRRHSKLKAPASAYFNGGLKKLLDRHRKPK